MALNNLKNFRKNLFDLSLNVTAARQQVLSGMLTTFLRFYSNTCLLGVEVKKHILLRSDISIGSGAQRVQQDSIEKFMNFVSYSYTSVL